MANQYRGLLIGNAVFPRDPHALPALKGPLVDVDQLGQALTDDEVGLFSPENVQMLPDNGVQELREAVYQFFANAAREDVLLLYYSGHGELDVNGRLYLCAKDTMAGQLPSTALSAVEINGMIDGSAAATTIIVLDCCHSGAFKAGIDLTTPVAGRGRYVLTSNRSTQLALAATAPGQPSPFTGMLVQGLRHADAEGHLTVADLYKQVYQSMTKGRTALVPQLKFSGEGEIVIARRSAPHAETPAQLNTERNRVPPSSRESPPLVELQVEPAQQPESPGAWQAHRVCTGGVACILRVTNGTEEHIIEYRSRPQNQAVVLLDGKRIYRRGKCFLDCTFTLGEGGPEARLRVTKGPDIQLWVGHRQVYSLHQAVPGTDDFREHRAAAVRTALLDTRTYGIRLRVVPDIGFWDRQAVQARTHYSARLVSAESVIGVASAGEKFWSPDRIWFTDQALYIHVKSGLSDLTYEELAAVAVTAERHTRWLKIGDQRIELQEKRAREFAVAINAVKTAIVYQGTGLGDAPKVHLFSGAQTSYTWGPMVGDWFKLALSAIVLLAVMVTTGDLYLNTDPYSLIGQFGVLFVSGIVGLVPAVSLAGIVESLEVRPSFSLTLFFLAVFTVTTSTVATWWLFGIENVPLIALIIFFPVAALSMFQRHRRLRASWR